MVVEQLDIIGIGIHERYFYPLKNTYRYYEHNIFFNVEYLKDLIKYILHSH